MFHVMQVLREEYGSDEVGFYSADTFNEMTPPSSDPVYLTSVTSAIYNVRNLSPKTILPLCQPLF